MQDNVIQCDTMQDSVRRSGLFSKNVRQALEDKLLLSFYFGPAHSAHNTRESDIHLSKRNKKMNQELTAKDNLPNQSLW